MFKICFTVEAHGFNICNSRRIRALKQYKIRWKPLILINLNNLPNFNILPCIILEPMRLLINPLYGLIILNDILTSSLKILKEILKHGNEYNWDQS